VEDFKSTHKSDKEIDYLNTNEDLFADLDTDFGSLGIFRNRNEEDEDEFGDFQTAPIRKRKKKKVKEIVVKAPPKVVKRQSMDLGELQLTAIGGSNDLLTGFSEEQMALDFHQIGGDNGVNLKPPSSKDISVPVVVHSSPQPKSPPNSEPKIPVMDEVFTQNSELEFFTNKPIVQVIK